MAKRKTGKAGASKVGEQKKNQRASISNEHIGQQESTNGGQYAARASYNSQDESEQKSAAPFNPPHGSESFSDSSEVSGQSFNEVKLDSSKEETEMSWSQIVEQLRLQKTLLSGDLKEVAGKVQELATGISSKVSSLISEHMSSQSQLSASLKKAGENILSIEKSVIDKVQGMWSKTDTETSSKEEEASVDEKSTNQ